MCKLFFLSLFSCLHMRVRKQCAIQDVCRAPTCEDGLLDTNSDCDGFII